jgi:hypothetical protein
VRKRVAVVEGVAKLGGDFDVVDIAESGLDDISGADVVVIGAPSDAALDAIRDRAPNAVVVVVGESPQRACEATLFPRARIIGIDDGGELGAVVDSIVFDRGQTFTAVARCLGERGIEDEFARVPVRIGTRGIVEIVES